MTALSRDDPPWIRAVAGGVLLDVAAMAPVALAGAMAVQIQSDLAFDAASMGVAVSGFFASGSIVAALVRSRLDRLGWRRGALLGGGTATLALTSLAVGVRSWGHLTLALLLAGAGLAIVMPATNVLLARAVPVERLAGVLGVKQAAIPLALLAAGAAVPALALTVGWRWAFGGAALVAPAGGALLVRWRGRGGAPADRLVLAGPAAIGPRAGVPHPASGDTGVPAARPGQRPRALQVLSAAVGLASLLPGALTAFSVVTMVGAGVAPATAGMVFAAANATGLCVRLLAGAITDRTGSDAYVPVAALMVAGGLGAGLLGSGHPALVVPAAFAAFGLGWGWPGLLFYLVVRANPDAPGGASAAVQAGGMVGAAIGPALAGAVAASAGWTAAWGMMGAVTALGGVLVWSQRPPAAPSP